MIGAGGAVRHVEVRARRWLDEQGRVVSTGVIRDVEERLQLERRLDSEMTRLRSIVESGGALIVLVDRALNVAMVNSGFTALTGISAADAVGRPLQEVLPCPLNPERTKRSRFALKRRDHSGRERLIAVTATPATDADGAVSSIVLLGVDDTERREAEQALYNAERFATVGEMAGTMAHEISQPLQVINIACASALDAFTRASERDGPAGPVNPAGQARAHRQQVEQASRIIGDLRAFVRGTSSDTPEPFDPNEAVRRAIDLTGHGVREAGMTLSERLDRQLPSVVGDAGRLATGAGQPHQQCPRCRRRHHLDRHGHAAEGRSHLRADRRRGFRAWHFRRDPAQALQFLRHDQAERQGNRPRVAHLPPHPGRDGRPHIRRQSCRGRCPLRDRVAEPVVVRKVLIAGATGLVGHAAMKHFAAEKGCEVIAVSRRRPDETLRRALAAARSHRRRGVREAHAGVRGRHAPRLCRAL